MKNLIRLIAMALLGASTLAACGQKGPLFLPDNPSEIRPEAPAEEEQTDDEEDEESKDDSPR